VKKYTKYLFLVFFLFVGFSCAWGMEEKKVSCGEVEDFLKWVEETKKKGSSVDLKCWSDCDFSKYCSLNSDALKKIFKTLGDRLKKFRLSDFKGDGSVLFLLPDGLQELRIRDSHKIKSEHLDRLPHALKVLKLKFMRGVKKVPKNLSRELTCLIIPACSKCKEEDLKNLPPKLEVLILDCLDGLQGGGMQGTYFSHLPKSLKELRVGFGVKGYYFKDLPRGLKIFDMKRCKEDWRWLGDLPGGLETLCLNGKKGKKEYVKLIPRGLKKLDVFEWTPRFLKTGESFKDLPRKLTQLFLQSFCDVEKKYMQDLPATLEEVRLCGGFEDNKHNQKMIALLRGRGIRVLRPSGDEYPKSSDCCDDWDWY